MPSFSIALTGLEANSVALDTIGNNLANLNTTAFKTQTTTFSDLFYQNIGTTGSGDALQVGLGTQVAGTVTDYTGGSLNTATSSTDMAVNGTGFFVVDAEGAQDLTRDGNFQLDESGNLQTSSGDGVMGYAAVNGTVSTNTPLTTLQIPVNATQAASATANFSITANLDAAAAVGGAFSQTITMYDSLGTSHAATIDFTKTADNTWSYSISLPAADLTSGTTTANTTGTLTFDSSGNLLTPAKDVSGIQFTGLADDANTMTMNWDLYPTGSTTSNITQTVATSTSTAQTQDGYASGTYSGFSVSANGVITTSFSNGQTENVGQIAIAKVTNEEGLTIEGSNNYSTTAASGAASVGAAGAGGRGTIEDNELEASNVDISTEFADLIVAQRAFEANSKTVTTFDTVTQETINMIH
jgi:flagellar hook protein FlgE